VSVCRACNVWVTCVSVYRACKGDSTEAALLRFVELTVGNSGDIRRRNRRVCDIPFTSTIKYQVSEQQSWIASIFN